MVVRYRWEYTASRALGACNNLSRDISFYHSTQPLHRDPKPPLPPLKPIKPRKIPSHRVRPTPASAHQPHPTHNPNPEAIVRSHTSRRARTHPCSLSLAFCHDFQRSFSLRFASRQVSLRGVGLGSDVWLWFWFWLSLGLLWWIWSLVRHDDGRLSWCGAAVRGVDLDSVLGLGKGEVWDEGVGLLGVGSVMGVCVWRMWDGVCWVLIVRWQRGLT
ncbi:hypothetical protein BDW02DRAFT_337747 [Decorospora gaudefroyi]|uniref:Uncharacterized protein n=1 Tax=Decorospora gaudefroyi TaxID=184978 RepID=A0A6A5KVY9_9PLEO|nr:hypothetical protein BDW02DRAFT_337747 [Decorospora gaudefroyi]